MIKDIGQSPCYVRNISISLFGWLTTTFTLFTLFTTAYGPLLGMSPGLSAIMMPYFPVTILHYDTVNLKTIELGRKVPMATEKQGPL